MNWNTIVKHKIYTTLPRSTDPLNNKYRPGAHVPSIRNKEIDTTVLLQFPI